MANQIPYYFLAPTWDCPPGGPIKLGNIITSLKKPDRPIYAVPKTLAIGEPGDIFTTEKYDVEFSRQRLRTGSFSILTKFLSSVVGLGVDVGIEVDHGIQETYSFSKITTTQFNPNPSYTQTCLTSSKSAELARYLQISRYRKPLYIITGIKSATPSSPSPSVSPALPSDGNPMPGARATGTSSRTEILSTSLSLELDGSILSGGTVPVGGGPTIGRRLHNKTSMSWQGASEFVFAYRVRKVWVKPVARGVGAGTVEVRKELDYNKGAFLGHDGGGGREGAGAGLGIEVEVDMKDDGVDLENEMEMDWLSREEVVDDESGEVVFCGILVEDDSDDAE